MNMNKLINMTFTKHAMERAFERELFFNKKSLLKCYRESEQVSPEQRFNKEKNIMFVTDRYTLKVVTIYRKKRVAI